MMVSFFAVSSACGEHVEVAPSDAAVPPDRAAFTPPANSEAAETATGFRQALARKRCEQRRRCDAGHADAAFDRAMHAAEDCAQARPLPSPELDAFIAAGTTRYDPRNGFACLQSFEELCAGGSGGDCGEVFVGLKPDRAACHAHAQCASGFCPGTDTERACSTCITTADTGAPCGTGTACRDGSRCTYTEGVGAVCVLDEDHEPVRSAALFASCAHGDGESVACPPDAFCDRTTLLCTPRLPIDAPCTFDSDSCVPGAICAGSETQATCTMIVVAQEVGAYCGGLDLTTICDPSLRLYCGFDDTCRRLEGDGQPGSQCELDTQCASGHCVDLGGASDVCVSGDTPNGNLCTSAHECASGSCYAKWEGFPANCNGVPLCP